MFQSDVFLIHVAIVILVRANLGLSTSVVEFH